MKTIVKGVSSGKWLERDMFLAYAPFAPKCERCDNSGLVFVANGEDDFDMAYDTCVFGNAKKMREMIDTVASLKRV